MWIYFIFYAAVLGVLFAHLTPALFFRWYLVMFCIIIADICQTYQTLWISTWLGDDLPSFEYFRKTASTTSLQKAKRDRLIVFIFVNTIQHPSILKNNVTVQANEDLHHFSFKYQICTWLRSSHPFCWQNPCSGCNSRINLVVFLEYTFFQLFWSAEQIA